MQQACEAGNQSRLLALLSPRALSEKHGRLARREENRPGSSRTPPLKTFYSEQPISRFEEA